MATLRAALVLAAVGPSTTIAGQALSGLAPADASAPALLLPTPPADTGKPALTLPPAILAPDPATCVPMLPCGSHLVGEVRKDGAIVLQVPALRW